jgi:hypothetical protein
MSPIDREIFDTSVVDPFPHAMKKCQGKTCDGRSVIGILASEPTYDGIMVTGHVQGLTQKNFHLTFAFALSDLYDMVTGQPKLYQSPFAVALGTPHYKVIGYHQRQFLSFSADSTVGPGVELIGKVSVMVGGKVSIRVYDANRHCHTGKNAMITAENERSTQYAMMKNTEITAINEKFYDRTPIPLIPYHPLDLVEHCSSNTANTLCDVCPVLFSTSFSVRRFLL